MSQKNITISCEPGKNNHTLCSTSSSSSIPSHGNGLLVLLDILQELNGTLQLPSVNSLSGLTGVLEGDSEVGTASAGRLGRVDLCCCVSNLEIESISPMVPARRCFKSDLSRVSRSSIFGTVSSTRKERVQIVARAKYDCNEGAIRQGGLGILTIVVDVGRWCRYSLVVVFLFEGVW